METKQITVVAFPLDDLETLRIGLGKELHKSPERVPETEAVTWGAAKHADMIRQNT